MARQVKKQNAAKRARDQVAKRRAINARRLTTWALQPNERLAAMAEAERRGLTVSAWLAELIRAVLPTPAPSVDTAQPAA